MNEVYPTTYFEGVSAPAELSAFREIGLRLGLMAIKSRPVVVAHIEVPDEDVMGMLADVRGGSASAGSLKDLDLVLNAETGFRSRSVEVARAIFNAFEFVLASEEAAHGLANLPHGEITSMELHTTRNEGLTDSGMHVDTERPFPERDRLGRLLPLKYHSSATVGAVRYTASFGPEAEEGGTWFIDGNVSQLALQKQTGLHARARSFPAGTVVRFPAESGVHERSPHRRPRAFITGTRWRIGA